MPKRKREDELLEEKLLAQEMPEEMIDDDELGEVDDDEVNAAINSTISQAEGDFMERNGVNYGGGKNSPKQRRTHKTVIGEQEVKNAVDTLKKYKTGKQNFDARVVDNEEWWKLRHWNGIRKTNSNSVEPTSAWLFNSIMNKLADYSDNYPESNIRARTQKDVKEAERIKHILPMIFEANDYEKTYMDGCLSKVKNGTSVTGVFWNGDKDDIDIQNIDVLSIYWEPGVKDIQASRNVFTIELLDNEVIKEMYPDAVEELKGGDDITLAKYIYEDYINTDEKTAVVDWYYKRKGILHYCKFVNNTVLVSTKNEPDIYPHGLYDDGEYPFIFDTLFKMEGTIAGFGYLDVCRSPQEYIDRLDQAIITNALMCAVPRYFKRRDASINEDEFLDLNQSIVECANITEDDLRQIVVSQLGAEVFNARDGKIQELKQTSGNSDVNNGTVSGGVTAASSIAQLIETGSKASRLTIKSTYRAYREVVYMAIERMRQFYDTPRYVRITNDDGTDEYTTYDNSGLVEQAEEGFNGETVYRLPQFDIEVTAQKSSPYNKMNQNELALQFYQYQFFNPQNADATLAALDMMDFDHKDDIIKKVKQNGMLFDALMQAQQQMAVLQDENQKLKVMADLAYDTNLAGGQEAAAAQPTTSSSGGGTVPTPTGNPFSKDETGSRAEKLRRQVADSTEV